MLLHVTVIPCSSHAGVIDHDNDHLKVKVIAPPKKGKANAELCRILADYFKVTVSQVRIVRGHRVRKKVIAITNRIDH